MIKQITNLGQRGVTHIRNLGRSGVFFFSILYGPIRLRDLVKQLYMVGVLSLAIVIVSGGFIGFVLGLQGFYTLSQFGADSSLGQLIALSIVRELGPVVTALLFAGRAGSALTSEIGLMKATEQLSAMQMMAVDPIRRVVAPRFWAGQISLPLLTLIFSSVAILGGYWVGVSWLGVDAGSFWNNMQASVSFQADIVNGIIKSFFFGLIVTWISVYQGYHCVPNSEGIAKATTRTVVYASLAILAVDFLLTAIMFN